jgi:DNA-3-methyladenine glycosylase I
MAAALYQIGPIHARCVHPNSDVLWADLRLRDLSNGNDLGTTGTFKDDRTHRHGCSYWSWRFAIRRCNMMSLTTYCDIAPGHQWHGPYHDREYGFPLVDDAALFERLMLEINQAGLSWLTILKKREAFRWAYGNFIPEIVAAYGARDRRRLLSDPGIVRNRLKVEAAVLNAKTILALRDTHGSFAGWLAAHHPRSRDEWTKLFRKTFRFTGGEIVNEFLMSVGVLPGAHQPTCPVYRQILKLRPLWTTTG